MTDARVLVVDDSAAMRALFSDILEQSKNVEVIGTAASADEARTQIALLHPNVLTLDVEMPGMSGIDFLAELMSSNPMPVVMLSSLTQAGNETSLKAYDLGAVECFPKPLKATPEQFAKTVAKLGGIVFAAANSNLRDRKHRAHRKTSEVRSFAWNGRICAINASMGGIHALNDILVEWPGDCPPTIITLQTEPALVNAFILRLDGELTCSVVAAKDGAALLPGTIHIAADPDHHAIIEPGLPPKIRLITRDAVDGARPSGTLLFGTIARSGAAAVGAVITGTGNDGAKGLKMMRDAGCRTFAQKPSTATIGEMPAAAIAAGGVEQDLPLDRLGQAIIDCCHQA